MVIGYFTECKEPEYPCTCYYVFRRSSRAWGWKMENPWQCSISTEYAKEPLTKIDNITLEMVETYLFKYICKFLTAQARMKGTTTS